MRVASYNIRKCVGLDWKRNPDRIQKVLAEINADIVLLQEVDKRLQPRYGTLNKEKLYSELGYQFIDIAENDVSQGWHGNTILYKPQYTPIKTDRIEIPTLEPRGAVAAVFESENNQPFQVIGSHLSLLKKTRMKQIDFLADYILTHKESYPTLIGGDFNEKNAEIWFKNNDKLNDLKLITAGKSFHTSKPMLNLDRFIITPQIFVEKVAVHHSENTSKASDHLPIFMDIIIK